MFPAEEVRKSSLPPVRVRLPVLRQGIVIFKSKDRLILRVGSELLPRNRAHALKSSPPNDSVGMALRPPLSHYVSIRINRPRTADFIN